MRKEAGELAALETRYWHGFNDLQLHMRAHAEERDVLLRRVRDRCVWMYYSILRHGEERDVLLRRARECVPRRQVISSCSCALNQLSINVGADSAALPSRLCLTPSK